MMTWLFRGDPEKCDNYGNTGLHLSAAKVAATILPHPPQKLHPE